MVVMLGESVRWSLGWSVSVPLWGWLVVALLIAAVVLWAYSRLPGSIPLRITGGVLRGLTMLLIAMLLAGPQAIWSRDRVEPDRVVVLIDRSLSMTLTDAGFDDQARPRSRDTAARTGLAELSDWIKPKAAEGQLARQREATWIGFGDNLQSIDSDPGAWPEAVGRASRLDEALREALESSDRALLAGVVLVSDGRTHQPLPPALLQELEQAGAPVYAIAVGGDSSLGDLAVADVQAPEAVFLGDRVPVRVTVRGHQEDSSARVRLIDKESGAVLDDQPVEQSDSVQLLARPEEAGERTWVVEIVAADDRLPDNNQRERTIRIVDRPVRVLLVDGYPRWEFRYLKNLLLRERSVSLSSLLLSADRGFAQEGDEPIQRFPETQRELEPYDLIILGDVPPSFLTDHQSRLLLDHVGEDGAGLIWVGGQQHMPASYAGTSLEPLLPTRAPSSSVGRMAAESSWLIAAAPAARALGLLAPEAIESRRGFIWMQAVVDPKPAAQPLLLATHPSWPGETWAVTAMRYGAGQTLYLATDEWWRWRYGQGEGPYAEFWLPLIRLAVRDRLSSGSSESEAISVDPGVITLGQTAVVTWTGPSAGPPTVAVDRQGLPSGRLDLVPEGPGVSTRWAGRLVPSTPGVYTLQAGSTGPQTSLTVLDDTPEYRVTEPDRALLADLAMRTSGRLLELDEASGLAGSLPSRARTVVEETRESIWSSATLFVLLIGMLTAEWVVRRIAGLS
ncbi:MAG: vWA domain-containing protein [Phycisphaeraceae bacterium]